VFVVITSQTLQTLFISESDETNTKFLGRMKALSIEVDNTHCYQRALTDNIKRGAYTRKNTRISQETINEVKQNS
jgi:hypothetical protein